MSPVEQHILNLEEPYKAIILYIRSVIFKKSPNTEEKYKYRVPYYTHNNKPMLYLNILKGTNYVDVAFVQGILLEEKYPELKNKNNRKQVRSLQVKNLEDFDELQFVKLLKDATVFLDNSRKAWGI